MTDPCLADYDWSSWQAEQHATLLFVLRGEQILLIRKKRGLGAGKINGPGGKLDPGETPLACAVRETREEVGIIAVQPRAMGQIDFQFVRGLTIRGYIFRADDHHGTPTETAEALPLWHPVHALPFDEMWQDDAVWLPWLIEDRRFAGRVLIGSGDRMLEHDLCLLPGTHRWAWE